VFHKLPPGLWVELLVFAAQKQSGLAIASERNCTVYFVVPLINGDDVWSSVLIDQFERRWCQKGERGVPSDGQTTDFPPALRHVETVI